MGIIVDFTCDKSIKIDNTIFCNAVYKLCQEVLTNSIRHGKAKNINIIFHICDSYFKIYIIDDGIGCTNIIMGVGLSLMKKRAKELGGIMTFGSNVESGFNINIKIPIKEGVI